MNSRTTSFAWLARFWPIVKKEPVLGKATINLRTIFIYSGGDARDSFLAISIILLCSDKFTRCFLFIPSHHDLALAPIVFSWPYIYLVPPSLKACQAIINTWPPLGKSRGQAGLLQWGPSRYIVNRKKSRTPRRLYITNTLKYYRIKAFPSNAKKLWILKGSGCN